MCDRVERNLRSIGVFMNHSGNRSTSEDRLSTSKLKYLNIYHCVSFYAVLPPFYW